MLHVGPSPAALGRLGRVLRRSGCPCNVFSRPWWAKGWKWPAQSTPMLELCPLKTEHAWSEWWGRTDFHALSRATSLQSIHVWHCVLYVLIISYTFSNMRTSHHASQSVQHIFINCQKNSTSFPCNTLWRGINEFGDLNYTRIMTRELYQKKHATLVRRFRSNPVLLSSKHRKHVATMENHCAIFPWSAEKGFKSLFIQHMQQTNQWWYLGKSSKEPIQVFQFSWSKARFAAKGKGRRQRGVHHPQLRQQDMSCLALPRCYKLSR